MTYDPLRDRLPEHFRLQEASSGRYKSEVGCISRSVYLDSFSNVDKRLFAGFMISINSPYDMSAGNDFGAIILHGVLRNDEVVDAHESALDRQYWHKNQLEDLLSKVCSIGVPWLEKMSQPDSLISFLEVVKEKSFSIDSPVFDRCRTFAQAYAQRPAKHRPALNQYLAPIYEQIGKKHRALSSLKQLEEYVELNRRPNADAEYQEAYDNRSANISNAIRRLDNESGAVH